MESSELEYRNLLTQNPILPAPMRYSPRRSSLDELLSNTPIISTTPIYIPTESINLKPIRYDTTTRLLPTTGSIQNTQLLPTIQSLKSSLPVSVNKQLSPRAPRPIYEKIKTVTQISPKYFKVSESTVISPGLYQNQQPQKVIIRKSQPLLPINEYNSTKIPNNLSKCEFGNPSNCAVLYSTEYKVVNINQIINYPNVEIVDNIVIQISSTDDIDLLNKLKNLRSCTFYLNPISKIIDSDYITFTNIYDYMISSIIYNRCEIIKKRLSDTKFAFTMLQSGAFYEIATFVYQPTGTWMTGNNLYIPLTISALKMCAKSNIIMVPYERELTIFGKWEKIPGGLGVHTISRWLQYHGVSIVQYILNQDEYKPIIINNYAKEIINNLGLATNLSNQNISSAYILRKIYIYYTEVKENSSAEEFINKSTISPNILQILELKSPQLNNAISNENQKFNNLPLLNE